MSFKSSFGALGTARGSWLGFSILIMIWIWSPSWFKGEKNIHIIWVLFWGFGDLEDLGGSWLRFLILILIWIWSLVLYKTIFWVLALYLDFEDIKTTISFKSWYGPLEDTGCSWLKFGILSWFGYGFLTGVWHPDIDLDMITGLWFSICQILALYLDFEGANNIHFL